MTDQPEPANQPEEPAIPPPGTGRARIALRVSMVVMALAMVAFTYFTPVWVDRGLSRVNEDMLRDIAESTAQMIAANDWNVEQGMDYAQRQTRIGKLETAVYITITGTAVTVRITGTAASANPFASLTGRDPVNRIEVAHTLKK